MNPWDEARSGGAWDGRFGSGNSSTRWLVLGDPDGPIDLARLFPDVEMRMERESDGFADALTLDDPHLVVLMAPPAGPADLQRVAAWVAGRHPGRAVLLSRHEAVAVRLHALELGFHDAIDLGADPMEVVGRLSIAGHRAIVLEARPSGRVTIGHGIALDLYARALWRDGQRVPLRPKEFELLEFLATHPGRAFTRHELLSRLWRGSGSHERVVDVYVFWLRSKIERDAAAPQVIVTVRGSGYRFDPAQIPQPGLHPPTADGASVNDLPMPR